MPLCQDPWNRRQIQHILDQHILDQHIDQPGHFAGVWLLIDRRLIDVSALREAMVATADHRA